ncbi:MAG: hypothetical protein ACRYFA_10700 [Janthinobacterium lividum]
MFNFSRKPFIYLPFKDSDLFNLTCEYCISLLEKIDSAYIKIVEISTKINVDIPSVSFELYKECFGYIESYIECYARLVKSVKLSLGQSVGFVKNPQKILNSSNYNPNSPLQEAVADLRNTSQHFEERLQVFAGQVDPFLKLYYVSQNISWEIIFGKGGYSHSGSRTSLDKEDFDITKLYFQSYKTEDKFQKLLIEKLCINDLWQDAKEIFNLIEKNIELVRKQKEVCCPPVRGISTFISPDDSSEHI